MAISLLLRGVGRDEPAPRKTGMDSGAPEFVCSWLNGRSGSRVGARQRCSPDADAWKATMLGKRTPLPLQPRLA